jgi:ELWxxDGT repeat protein
MQWPRHRVPLTVEQLEDRIVPAVSLIKDIVAGAGDSSPASLTLYVGEVYFSADDGQHGNELWVTDGSEAGTHMVKDIRDGAGGSNPEYLFVAGGKLYFVADDGIKGRELWQTDGTNTSRVADINTTANGAGSAFVAGKDPGFTVAGGNLFYAANDGTTGVELWKTDLATGATALVQDIDTGAGDSNP